ncbi:MAG: sulfotransferase family 2 domain-containing protein [Pseudomonadota bacterium]
MLIFQKQNLAYLAVPKTGTTAIEQALDGFATAVFRDPPGLKHANARRFEREMRPLFGSRGRERLETIAVIRDPVDWLKSWYRYRHRPAIEGSANSTAGISFDQFIEAYLLEERPPFANIGAQSQFVADAAGKIIVDRLFQYERMDDLLEFLSERLGTEVTLSRVNTSHPFETTLSPDLSKELAAALEPDLDLHRRLSDGPLSFA